ncbi:MAG: GspE/PulE family protein [Candidatus Omnitrophica bacterium]|nr:GspE/PulE family protein [Candidatus Omnitrophota bacterium]
MTLKEEIIQIILESKHITKEQLEEAILLQQRSKLPLRKILIDQKLINEEDLLSLFSQKLSIPVLHVIRYKLNSEIISIIPEEIATRYNIVPISRIGNNITIAISDPLDIFVIDDLRVITGCNIDIVLSPQEEIEEILNTYYKKELSSRELPWEREINVDLSSESEVAKLDTIELSEIVKESQKPPIVRLVDLILTLALKRRASDIHIEPVVNGLRVRYRIDGMLYEMFTIPKIKQNAVLARLKIISNLDITENRLPQDGRFKVRFDSREIDFRVSVLPVNFGQKIVLRILDKSNLSIGLDKLGFSPQPLKLFNEAIGRPFGMILVTGPTGSGKSTTLYSILNKLNTPQLNIVTIEDPVEYEIEGITQVQVKPEIGLTFTAGLRALLRQSPDVIMIGEIRDGETADTAVKAALTGQLILSTLHTNDAASSITRLIDMNVEPFLVASSLIMVCAQRLCRCICPRCKEEEKIPHDILDTLGFKEKITFYKGKGCQYCNNSGYYGRTAILEVLMINDRIREMIIEKRSCDEIKEYAVKELGMLTLRDDAFIKIKEGSITLEEAIRVTMEE